MTVKKVSENLKQIRQGYFRLAFITIFLITQLTLQLFAGWDLEASGAPAPSAGRETVTETARPNVFPDKETVLNYHGVKLEIPAGAVERPVEITVEKLARINELNPGISNATGGATGYRFKPDGMKFAKAIKVTIPFDKNDIKNQKDLSDLYTYFYDEGKGIWEQLERVAVDEKEGLLTSLTTHFTDMINGVLKLPESPTPLSFNPNSIKDIKAADPGTGINLIEAPQANNLGNANLQYPIEIPPGRNGMQPQVAVQYNSDGGDDWMGLGWDIAMQAVALDTRWGVPRYDRDYETETYMLEGMQLTPLAHRGDLKPRSSEKIFRFRVEGSFKKILRHGDKPINYWWEVTDKKGTRYFYGGTPEKGLDSNFVLATNNQNIFKWALKQVRDTNSNTIDYTYVKVSDSGIGDGTSGVQGSQLYLDTIYYTGDVKTLGSYAVEFFRDRELGEIRRTDITIEARNGAKVVTADLLRKIEVKFNDKLVRSYEFQYQEGAFNKNLLKTLIQYGSDGSEFNRHEFTYYDGVRSDDTYEGFGSTVTVDSGNDGLDQKLLGLKTVNSSALGSSTSSSTGVHLYGGFSYAGWTKNNSVGVKVGTGKSSSKDLETLIDLNGDGILDKVFQSDHSYAYRPGTLQSDGSISFDGPVFVPTLKGISAESSNNVNRGAEGYVWMLSNSENTSKTYTTGSTYFSDVNGDGLPDLVKNGNVYYNQIKNGIPTFVLNDSSGTPAPVASGAANTSAISAELQEEYQELLKAAPLMDAVRCWTAPYAGTINITAPVRLIQVNRGDYATADGVRIAIQRKNTELWSAKIGADDYSSLQPSGVDRITVAKGDRIYFRVQSINDGAYDQVEWDPEITYLNVSSLTDANGLNPYHFKASEDFIYGGRDSIVAVPFAGTIHLKGNLNKKAVTSDSIRLVVYKNDTAQITRELAWDSTGSITLNDNLTVAANDRIGLMVESDSPIDLSLIEWQPVLSYTAVDDPDNSSAVSGESTYQQNMAYGATIYSGSSVGEPLKPWEAKFSGTAYIYPSFMVTDPSLESQVTFTVKKSGILLAKKILSISGGMADGTIQLAVTQGDQLYMEFSSSDRNVATYYASQSVTVTNGPKTDYSTVYTPTSTFYYTQESSNALFPKAYRGWGVFAYNGQDDRASHAIDESLLKVGEGYAADSAKVYLMIAQPQNLNWGSGDDNCWISASQISSSRYGTDYIEAPGTGGDSGVRGVSRRSVSTQSATNKGISYAAISSSDGKSISTLDFMDLNGDRYPDVVTSGSVQYSTMTGGLADTATAVPALSGGVRSSSTESENTGISGTVQQMVADVKGRHLGSPQAQTKWSMAPLGVKISLKDSSSSDGDTDLIDMNGDGLPDRISQSGNKILVALNLGYSFDTSEDWGSGVFNSGSGENPRVEGNLGWNSGNYGFAGGFSYNRSKSRSEKSLVDLNGDGLVDLVTSDGSTMKVAFNTGGGFTNLIEWQGAISGARLNDSQNSNVGAGVYYTQVFPLPFPLSAMSIIVNPGADHSEGLGSRTTSLTDLNGDGLPDHVTSSSESSIRVALNQTGTTNKLKTVNRPLGATFTLSYTRSGNTYDQPQNNWVLSRVEVSDGHVGDGVDNQLFTFIYSGGKQDRYERQFFGYRGVVTEFRDPSRGEAVYKILTRNYYNDSYFNKGLVESETVRDGNGRIYIENVNQYVLWDVDTENVLVNLRPFNAEHTVFPQLKRADKRFYEGQYNYGAWTYENFDYDKYGNVTYYYDAGDPNLNDDDVQANIDYKEDLTPYIVEKPLRIRVFGNGVLMRERQGDYDSAGNITELRQYLNSGQAQTTNFTYYANGNLKEIIGPPNQTNQQYTVILEYDPVVNTHITTITDSFKYVSTSSYDYLFGVETNSTDLNGNPMRKVYDNFGRLKQLFAPYDTNIPAIDFEYHPEEFPARAVTKNKIYFDSTNSDTLDTVIFIDGLKRVIQTKKNGEVLPAGTTSAQYGMNVTGKVIFDALGRTWQQGQPVFQEGYNTNFFDNISLKNPTVNQYDILDRTVQVTLPDNSAITSAYDIENGLFKTTVKDPEGKVKNSYQDINGNTVRTVQFNTGKTITTSYDYDPLDQIVKITDDHNNITRMVYDFLGQRTGIESPDAGLVEYTYDMAGNLTKKVDANLREKNLAINYLYDYNRLKKIDYPASIDVEYSYGGADADENRVGRIVKITDESGTTEFSYGKLGEETKTTKDLNFLVPGHKPWKFMTETDYDYLGRVQRIRYPDKEQIEYTYDRGGQIKAVEGKKQNDRYVYVKQIGYDEFGQRVYIKYGNDVETRYTYDPYRRWLADINTKNNYNTTFQDLKYSFDRVGNVLSITNQARNVRQDFQYDDLYQLVTAKGVADDHNKRNEYHQTFDYDTIGNITKKTSYNHLTPGNEKPNVLNYTFNYLYTGTKPHAPAQIGNWTYTYDANGNVTKKERLVGTTSNSSQNDRKDNGNDKEDKTQGQKDGLTYGSEELNNNKNKVKKDPPGQSGRNDSDIEGGGTSGEYFWNEENRLIEAKDDGNGKSTYFLYDYNGDRTVKRGQGGETLYVNEYYQLQNQNIITKHIFVGNTRIVSKLTHYENYDSAYEKKNIYTYHPDHLGSSNFVTDPEGNEFEHMEYTPYGESWVDEGTNKNVIGYRFTSKELDTETGLYYFGARYLDPLASRWASPDPAFEKYLPEAPMDDEARERNRQLPGMGGVFNPFNLNVYNYANNNPLRYVDPNGRDVWDWVQGGLDVVGLVPGFGEPADGLNGLISLGRGDKLGAGLSFAAMIPVAGWFSTGGKFALKYGDEVVSAGKTIIKVGENSKLAFKGGFAPGKWLTHFEKHCAEFGYKTSAQYLKGAQDLISAGLNKADGILTYTRKNGDVLVYNQAKNEFAATTKDGVIKTYFKPKEGIDYWKSQTGGQ